MEKSKRFYLIEYAWPSSPPVTHTRIVYTDDMKAVAKRLTGHGWTVNFWNLISVDRARELQDQYKMVII